MNRRWIAMIALVCLAAGFVPAQVAAVCASAPVHDDVCHTESIPCADPDQDGNPCGSDCPCACCPGHGAVPMFMVECLTHEVRPASIRIGLRPDAPAPRDTQHGIFHPPRA